MGEAPSQQPCPASPLLPLPRAKVIRVRLVLLVAHAWLAAMRWTWYKVEGSRPRRTKLWEEAFRTVSGGEENGESGLAAEPPQGF